MVSSQPHFDIKNYYRIGEDDKEDREGKLPGPEVDTGPDNALPLPAANLSRSSSALKAFKVWATLLHSSGAGLASCSLTSYTQIFPLSSPAIYNVYN
jgi:hypothetical protein